MCVLAMLSDGESYGYQLAQSLDAAGVGPIQGGTLYPVLAAPADAPAWSPRRGGRASAGPARKYYRHHRRGRAALRAAAATWLTFAQTVSEADGRDHPVNADDLAATRSRPSCAAPGRGGRRAGTCVAEARHAPARQRRGPAGRLRPTRSSTRRAVAESIWHRARAAPRAGPAARRRHHQALRPANRAARRHLTVRAGQIAAVVGANGCGKSTLLRICAGLMSPDAGKVTVAGRLGYCPQYGGTADFLSPDEHFVLVGAGQGMARGPARRAGRAAPDSSAGTRAATAGPAPVRRHPAEAQPRPCPRSARPTCCCSTSRTRASTGHVRQLLGAARRLRDAGAAIVVVTHLLNQLDRVDIVLDLTRHASRWRARHPGRPPVNRLVTVAEMTLRELLRRRGVLLLLLLLPLTFYLIRRDAYLGQSVRVAAARRRAGR